MAANFDSPNSALSPIEYTFEKPAAEAVELGKDQRAAGLIYRNNFGLVRLLLAVIVLVTHIQWLIPGSYGPLAVVVKYFDGPRAVDCFFVLSGYLIFQSCRRSSSLRSYFSKRLRRIYPALAMAVFLAVVLGAISTTLPLFSYVSSLRTLRYIVCNLLFATFAAPTLPGVFEHNTATVVNGSLWTLKIEVMFYLAVPLCLWAARFIRFEVMAGIIYVTSVAFRMTMIHLAMLHHSSFYDELGRQLPGQMSFFIVGALIEYRIREFRKVIWGLLPAAIAVLFFGFYPIYPAAVAVIVIWMCEILPCVDFTLKTGDYSYGLYVMHFPILQTFAALGLVAAYPTLQTLTAFALCLLMAVISWHFIEKPAIKSRRPPVRAFDQQAVTQV